jgi:hypothetical protein
LKKDLIVCSQAQVCESEQCRFRWTLNPYHDRRVRSWDNVLQTDPTGWEHLIGCEDIMGCGRNVNHSRLRVVKYES